MRNGGPAFDYDSGVNVIETIADRRILQARADGLFDNLPGAGKPLPDLHRERPAGWWAARVVQAERSKVRADALKEELRAAMAALWRMDAEPDVRTRVGELNEQIEEHNRLTTLDEWPPLDPGQVVERWRALRRRS